MQSPRPALLLLVVLFLAAHTPTGSAVQCWTCASDLDNRCGDPFSETLVRDQLTNCDAPSSGGSGYNQYQGNARSVCKKSKQIITTGAVVIIRSCAWQLSDQSVGTCPETSSPSHVRVTFCETCDYDGCNGGSSIVALPALLLLPALAVLLRLK